MSRKALALLVPLLAIGAAQAQSAPDHAPFEREARVSISPEGKVTSLKFVNTNATNDVLGGRLESVVRAWSFEPGKVDGKPVATETTLHLHLDMRKNGVDDYAITLLGANTGVGRGQFVVPSYPKAELANGVEAKLSLLITVSAEGAPIEIHVERVRSTGSANDNARFQHAAVDAAKQWTYVPESVGGHGLVSTVRVPIYFCIDGMECRKLASDATAPSSAPSGSVATLESHARLLTQVAGTTL